MRSTSALPATALALAAVLTLSACGGTSEATPTAEASAPSEDTAFPRTVEHAMGEAEIPERPERVVVLDTGELDSVLSLGIVPAGAVTTDVSEEFLSYLAEDAEGVEVVGTIAEPNLEELTLADADVVLYSSYGSAEDSGETAALAGPLWSRLGAVQADRAIAVEDDVFSTGIGLTAARLQVEDLERQLVG